MKNALTVIDNHSVALEYLRKGPVLDAGSRGFVFSKFFAERGHKVVALDPGEDGFIPTGVSFLPVALMAQTMDGRLVLTQDKEARYVIPEWKSADDQTARIKCLDIRAIMRDQSIDEWDLVKLNIEGAEFDVLSNWHPGVARQIVVSFHEHTARARGRAAVDALVEKLAADYHVLRHVWDERYCAGSNAWDTVLVRKGI